MAAYIFEHIFEDRILNASIRSNIKWGSGTPRGLQGDDSGSTENVREKKAVKII